MKSSVLIRTGSIPVHTSAAFSGSSPVVSLSRSDSLTTVNSIDKTAGASPKISLHFDVNGRRGKSTIRRATSESDILRSNSGFSGKQLSLPASHGGRLPGTQEMNFSGGDYGIKSATIGMEEKRKIGEYYQEMLRSNPGDALLLRNYGQFLHEVEKDMVRAEEYYCRAILASPGDGELLSLYGKLIWESQKNKVRARSYFDQAVSASPDSCTVMGSFASFMWETEEDEEQEININSTTTQVSSVDQLVPAF